MSVSEKVKRRLEEMEAGDIESILLDISEAEDRLKAYKVMMEATNEVDKEKSRKELVALIKLKMGITH